MSQGSQAVSSGFARGVAAVAALSLLTACNVAVSTKPLFRTSDAAGAPGLKPGLWSLKRACDEAGLACRGFNATRVLIGPADIDLDPTGPPATQPPPFETPVHYVLASGDPRVLQVEFAPKDKSGPSVAYVFFALQATARDPDGKITAADIWQVECGPPPKPGDPTYDMQDDERYETAHRLPGMVDSPVGDCAPSTAAVARLAAAASRDWDPANAFSINWMAAPPR
jgi:hypothetical protein